MGETVSAMGETISPIGEVVSAMRGRVFHARRAAQKSLTVRESDVARRRAWAEHGGMGGAGVTGVRGARSAALVATRGGWGGWIGMETAGG